VNDPLDILTDLFYPSRDQLGEFLPLLAAELPQQYQSLLAHHDHMTVTVEAWHNSLVEVRVLEEKREGDYYARKIVLARQRDGVVVQFGLMRINLQDLPEIVRLEIQSQALPLGRIMIRHHLLREVEVSQIWQIQPGPELRRHLHCSADEPIFGRTARILVEGQPVVELLEIVSV
jgi:chorismate-pyruvate lyase